MSNEDHLRRTTTTAYVNNPNIQKVEPHQVPDAWTATVIND